MTRKYFDDDEAIETLPHFLYTYTHDSQEWSISRWNRRISPKGDNTLTNIGLPKLASANLCTLQKLAFCKWMRHCGVIPKRYQITCTDLFLDFAQLVEWPLDLNSHFQKTTKDTYFSPASDQLILILTHSILFYSILFYYIIYKKT